MLRKYRKEFHVDRECAISELTALGIRFDDEYLSRLRRTVHGQFADEKKHSPICREDFDLYHGIEPESDDFFAYIAGYTSGGAPFGITWEEMEELERREEDANRGMNSSYAAQKGKGMFSVAEEMDYDTDKVDEATLALMALVVWQREESYGARVWKGFDWDTLDRLHEKGLISNPKGKAKSVVLTEEAYQKSQELFRVLFQK